MDNKPKDDLYYLYDGTKVTKDQILQVAYRYQGTYKGLGAIMVAFVLIITLGLIRDFKTLQLAFILTLFTIDIILFILAVLFFSMHRRMDLIKFGLSILNYRRKQMIHHNNSQDEYNTIYADTVITLSSRPRQIIFYHQKSEAWQYRMGKYLSMPYLKTDIDSIEVKQVRKNMFHVIISLNDHSGVIFHTESNDLATAAYVTLKNENEKELIN